MRKYILHTYTCSRTGGGGGGGGGGESCTHTRSHYATHTYSKMVRVGGRCTYHVHMHKYAYMHTLTDGCGGGSGGGGGSEGEGGVSRTGEGCGLFSVCGGGGVQFISVVTAVLWTGGISVFGTHSSVVDLALNFKN